MKKILLLLLLTNIAGAGDVPNLDEVLAGKHRSEKNMARDQYRHPQETLTFFGLKPDMAVMELWPGGGWYTEIIAPYVQGQGQFIAAHFNPETNHQYANYFKQSLAGFKERVANDPNFKAVKIVSFEPGVTGSLGDADSVDMVLTFRNLHNWIKDGGVKAALADVHHVLKPGGVFGVVDHRAAAADAIDPEARSGYVNQGETIKMVEAAGFRLVDVSEINANPNDHTHHANGVWTLKPTFRVPESEDKAAYAAIGESDRFTLKFVKR